MTEYWLFRDNVDKAFYKCAKHIRMLNISSSRNMINAVANAKSILTDRHIASEIVVTA